MISLSLGILTSAMVAISMRIAQPRVNYPTGFLAVNYIVCSLFALVLSTPELRTISVSHLSVPVGLGVLNGIVYLTGFLMMQWNIRHNGVVLSSAFMKLGILVPTLLSVVWFHEVPTVLQVIGFLVAIAAIITINFQKDLKFSRSSWLLLVLLILGGTGDGLSKVYEVYGDPAYKNFFLFFTFFCALILCALLLVYKKERIGWKELAYGTLLGIPNYLSTFFLLKSLSTVPAVIAFPTYSVGVILVVCLTGVLLFRERLNRRQVIGGLMICAALILLNV